MESVTSIKLFVFILLGTLLVIALFRWLASMEDEDEIKEVGLKRIAKHEFYKAVGRRFSCMRRWLASAETIDHYSGDINGLQMTGLLWRCQNQTL